MMMILVTILVVRGGDTRKWDASGIRHVLGIDISSESVKEARRRLDALQTCESALLSGI